jgi:hypothetical protein
LLVAQIGRIAVSRCTGRDRLGLSSSDVAPLLPPTVKHSTRPLRASSFSSSRTFRASVCSPSCT